MDTRLIARKVAGEMIEHRNRLAGKAEDANRAHQALLTTGVAITAHRDEHNSNAATATGHWDGENAAAFDRRARRMTASLDVTATAASKGATIVADVSSTVDGGHRAVVRLVEEYTTKASQALDAGLAVKGAGAQAAVLRAVGQVVELVRTYTGESAKQLATVRHQLAESAQRLRSLERAVERDGVVDPTRTRGAKPKGKRDKAKPDRKPGKPGGRPAAGSGVVDKIKKAARGQLGYREGPGNRNKYGPAEPWCARFATWVWRQSGVDIPSLGFTGAVYTWGQQHGLAYDSRHLDQARPGDVLLFGTGPQSTSTSTHIGIVESVHGDRVTLIEGNSGDQVQRVTHTLSSSTFYGGVHPR